ncbi:hypothetical protein, partial [Klebsiella pneumoniae]
VRLVVLVGLAIDQIAQSGLSSLSVIYYSAQRYLANVEMSCSKQVRDDVWESLENSFFSLSQAWRMVADARLSQ